MRIGIWENFPPVTKHILIVNLLVWLACNVSPSIHGFIQNYCALHYFTNPHFNVAQLLTYMFVQFDFMHMFFNMFAVFMFGATIERLLGSQRYLFFYISCGIGAALIQLGVFAAMISHYTDQLAAQVGQVEGALAMVKNEGEALLMSGMNWIGPLGDINALIQTPVVGASGAVYGLLLAFAMLLPNVPLYIMFIPVPVKAKWVVLGYAVIELSQAIANNPGDNVAHVAHLGGMVFGLLLILWWKHKGVIGGNGYY